MKLQIDWIQTLTLLALLAGIVLVIYELRQAKELTRSQLISQSYVASMQLDALVIGENGADTLARISDPNAKISESDLFIYDAIAHSRLLHLRMNESLHRLGYFPQSQLDLDDLQVTACWFFGHDVGRAYLESNATSVDPLVLKLKEHVQNCGESANYIEHMKKQLSAGRVDGT